MGKTYKKYPASWGRNIRGHKQSLINETRKPVPNPWDTQPIDKTAYMPGHIANRMHANGKTKEQIENTLRNKFKLKPHEIDDVIKRLR